MADDVTNPTDSGQMPSWSEVKSDPQFQGLSPDQQLVAFDRWHDTARTQLATTDPQWAQRRAEFDTNANLTAHQLGQAAAQSSGQERASTPDEARYRIAHDKLSQDPNATLPPDIADAYYKGPPENGRNFQIVGNELKLTPGHHVEGMQDLVNHGIKDQEWFNKHVDDATKLDSQYNDLVTSAGSAPELKALVDEGVKSYIGLQGGKSLAARFAPQITKWIGARLASGAAASAATTAAEPGIEAAGEAVEPIGGGPLLSLAVHGLAFMAGMMATNKATQGIADQLSKYNDTVKSFEAAAQLHPNYAAAGGLLGMGPDAAESIPKIIDLFGKDSVTIAGHTVSGPTAAILQMGANGAASVPLTFLQAGMEGRLPTLKEGAQNMAIGMLLAGSPHDTPAVAEAKGNAAERIRVAMQEAGRRTGQGLPETAKAEINSVKLEEAQKIMEAAKQDASAAPVPIVDKAEAKAGDHFVEDGKLFRMNEQGAPEEILPPVAKATAEAAPAGPDFAESREAAIPDEQGSRRYVENGSNIEEAAHGERRIVGPAAPTPEEAAATKLENERVDKNVQQMGRNIFEQAQKTESERAPLAERPLTRDREPLQSGADRIERDIARERQAVSGLTNDPLVLQAYAEAHRLASEAVGRPEEERPTKFIEQGEAPGLRERTPPRKAGEIRAPQREVQGQVKPALIDKETGKPVWEGQPGETHGMGAISLIGTEHEDKAITDQFEHGFTKDGQVLTREQAAQQVPLEQLRNNIPGLEPGERPAKLHSQMLKPAEPVEIGAAKRAVTRPGIEAAKKEFEKSKAPVKTNIEEEFFGHDGVFTKMLRKVGVDFDPKNPKDVAAAAKQAFKDTIKYFTDNPQLVDYYNKDTQLAREHVEAAEGRKLTDDEWNLHQIFSGITSSDTPLDRNVSETLAALHHYFDNGEMHSAVKLVPKTLRMEFKDSREEAQRVIDDPKSKAGQVERAKSFLENPDNPGTGNLVIEPNSDKVGFAGQTGPQKARNILIVQHLIDKFGVKGMVDHLSGSVSWDELQKFNKEVGFKSPLTKADILPVVKFATGQEEQIPRAFIFGKKVGAYILNSLGDHRFNTIDRWEARFIRSYFPELTKENTGLPAPSEYGVFHDFIEEYKKEYSKQTGTEVPNSALQAGRWYYILDAAKKAGFRVLTDEPISTYVEKNLKKLEGTSKERGGQGATNGEGARAGEQPTGAAGGPGLAEGHGQGVGTTAVGAGVGAEPGSVAPKAATFGGPVEIAAAARDQGWKYLPNRGWESENDKQIRGMLEEVFPEMFKGEKPLFNLIAAEHSGGANAWVHADGSPDIYFDAHNMKTELAKQVAEGKTPEEYIRQAMTEEMVHKLTAVDGETAQRLGRELTENTPDLARQIAERYFHAGDQDTRERLINKMLSTPDGHTNLYYEAVMDNALAQLRGEDRSDQFKAMPKTLFEHIVQFLNKILGQVRGRKDFAQFSPEMQKLVKTGIEGMKNLDQLYEARFGEKLPEEIGRTLAEGADNRDKESELQLAGSRRYVDNERGSFRSQERHAGLEASEAAAARRVAAREARPRVAGRELTPEEVAAVNSTARASGAVGSKAITPHYVADTVKPGETVLNFGAGKPDAEGKYAHSEQVAAKGAQVDNYDIGSNATGELAPHDTTFASNVLNVQPDWATLRNTLQKIKDSVKPGGRAVMNFPESPRKSEMSPEQVAAAIKDVFGVAPQQVGGTKGAPLWEVKPGAEVAASKREEPAQPTKQQARWENGKLVVEPVAESSQESSQSGGMARRVQEARMPGEVQRGTPRDAEQLRAIGEGRLAKGEDPQKTLDSLRQNGAAATPEDTALFQAQTRKLSAATDAAKAAGNNEAAEKAYVQEKAWRDQLAPFQQAWHESGVAQQEPENFDNEFGIQRAFENRYNRDMSEKQKQQAVKPVKAVKDAGEAVKAATAAMDKAVEGVKDTGKIPSDAKGLADYFNQRKGEGGQFVGAPTRTSSLIFTPDEVKQIWKFSKPIIENLQTFGDVNRAAEHVSNAMNGALTPEEIRTAWAQPKRQGKPVNLADPVAKQLFEAMSKRRAAVDQARAFLDRAGMTGFDKWMHDIMDIPRSLAILGHANPLVTHAGRNLFTPEAWSNWGSSFVKQFKFLVDPAAHEVAMQRILEDPLYQEAKIAKLRVSPYELEDYSRYNKVLGQMLGSRLAAVGRAGNRAMDALKVFRMEMYKQHMETVAGGLEGQDRADAAKYVAAITNHISGYSNNAATRFFKDIGFAPGLEGSRWAFIGDYKNALRTTAKLATGQTVSPADRAQATLVARRAAQFVGVMASALGANYALNKATGQDDNVNLTDPTQTDFMRFKWGGKTLDPTGGLFQPVRLLARMAAITQMEKGEKQGALLKEISDYASGKANPGITAAIELATGQDAIGRALPGRETTTTKEPYTIGEYALTHAPIPVAEMSKVIHDEIENSTDTNTAKQIMTGLLGLGFGVLGVKQGETPHTEWKPRP